jgi:predicted CopG family antitoxin
MPATADLKIDPETRDDLRRRKKGGETYDDVIQRLLNETNKTSGQAGNIASGDA